VVTGVNISFSEKMERKGEGEIAREKG